MNVSRHFEYFLANAFLRFSPTVAAQGGFHYRPDCYAAYANEFIDMRQAGVNTQRMTSLGPVAYPELVSRGVSKRRKCKWLVKVGASNSVNPPP